jgi:hypothetical protein
MADVASLGLEEVEVRDGNEGKGGDVVASNSRELE